MRKAPALAGLVLFACSSPTSVPEDPSPDAAPDVPARDAPVAGLWTTEPPCTASATDIYATPVGGSRGDVVACALGDLLSVAETQTAVHDAGVSTITTTGVRVVKLAFHTVRGNGSDAISTATVYLPITPRAMPAPLVIVGRSTAGIADSCAPSKDRLPQDNYALPLAARGFVTIAPDLAGLGTEGTHAYLDNHETAIELFDAVRAAQQLVPGHVVGDAVAAVGYSQGGGAVLSVQATEYEITGAHTLRAVAALAPEWPISTASFDYEYVLRHPDSLTGFSGLSTPVVAVLRQYGWSTNRQPAGTEGATFPAGERSSIIGAINSLCTVELGGALNAQQPKLGELTDPTFREQVLACIDGTTGCEGIGADFHAWLTGDFVTADPTGAPILITQGLADQVMPAAKEASCIVDKLRSEGVQPALCTDLTATHDTIPERKIADVIAWLEAKVDGTTAPSCASQTMPACSR